MSNQNHRDTQFAGFAKMLYEQLTNASPTYVDGHVRRGVMSRDEVEQIMARRAYDLAHHIIEHVEISAIDMLSIDECVERIPDLTKWPKEQ